MHTTSLIVFQANGNISAIESLSKDTPQKKSCISRPFKFSTQTAQCKSSITFLCGYISGSIFNEDIVHHPN